VVWEIYADEEEKFSICFAFGMLGDCNAKYDFSHVSTKDSNYFSM
jgi:hypothetical protein